MGWEWFFFWQQADDADVALWTVYLPASADWGLDAADVALVAEIQE